MTTVCLKAKSATKTDAWSSVFTSFNTDTKSCSFIKQLTSTCVSTILYLRKVLPDDYFETKNFEGMTLKLLKSKKGENYVSKIENWLEGAFEAIEKKYLKRLMLDIQDAESNMTLEIYTISFNYSKVPLNLKDSESSISTTKLNTIKLLQMCYAVTQTYSSLPSQVKLSIRLSYHENTPQNYQPKGYMAWDAGDPEFPKQPRSIEIGVTGTQHHFFKFLNKSCLSENFFKFQTMEDESENSHSTVPIGLINDSQLIENSAEESIKRKELCFNISSKNTEKDELIFPKANPETLFQLTEKCSDICHNHPNKPEPLQITCRNSRATTNKSVKIPSKLPIRGDLKVRCACLCSEISETVFPCLGCRYLVHSECFGILQFDSSKKIRFYCHLCHQTESNFKCHDRVITSLKSSSDQQKLSLLRRILRHCTMPYVNKITLKKMEKIAGNGCPKNVINVILNKMIEIQVAVPQGKKKNYLIDKQELANKLMHYFYKIQNSDPNQSQVSPYSLKASENTTNKNDIDELIFKEKSKPSTGALQELLTANYQTSQQSCDIFS